MTGLRPTKAFGQRRTGRASNGASAPRSAAFSETALSKRQREREDLWCVCYVFTEEFGQEVVRKAILLDRSDKGARVRCRSRALFPEMLRLHAPRIGLDVLGRNVWQKGFDTGISFDI